MKQNLLYAFNNKDYEKFLKVFSEYQENDLDIIIMYIKVLIYYKDYNNALNYLNNNEKFFIDNNLVLLLAELYFECKCIDKAIDLFKNIKIKDGYSLYLLGKVYLYKGDIKRANEYLISASNITLDENLLSCINKELIKIKNYYKGSFIEIDYNYFKSNKSLEPGHIISVNSVNGENDPKKINRQYMIFRIEDLKIYMFGILSSNKGVYQLYKSKYPNAKGERYIGNNMFYTSIDNVVSVVDKVNDKDYINILRSIYETVYFNLSESQLRSMNIFFRDILGTINIYDVVCYADKVTKDKNYYLVLDILDEYYKLVEYDINNKTIIGNIPVYYKKSKFILNKYSLTIEEVNNLNIPIFNSDKILSSVKNKDELIHSIINYEDNKYIIVGYRQDEFLCVDYIHMKEFLMFSYINEKSYFSLEGYLTDEEATLLKLQIENYHSHNCNNPLNYLKKPKGKRK